MPWFAVKTFLRALPTGAPKRRDKTYRAGLAAVEERVVLFRAKNAEAAIKKGRAEAAKYARAARTRNIYGQSVITQMLGYTETFELFEDPAEGAELFSSIEITPAGEALSSIVRRKVGKPASLSTARLFIASKISEKLNDKFVEW